MLITRTPSIFPGQIQRNPLIFLKPIDTSLDVVGSPLIQQYRCVCVLLQTQVLKVLCRTGNAYEGSVYIKSSSRTVCVCQKLVDLSVDRFLWIRLTHSASGCMVKWSCGFLTHTQISWWWPWRVPFSWILVGVHPAKHVHLNPEFSVAHWTHQEGWRALRSERSEVPRPVLQLVQGGEITPLFRLTILYK